MAQGDLLDPVKLGAPGDEMELSVANDADIVNPFTEIMGPQVAQLKTIGAIGSSAFHAQYDPRFRLVVDVGSPKTRDAIRSITAIADEQLSFVFADNWYNYSERYIMETTTTFRMRENTYQRLDAAYLAAGLGQILTQANMKVYTTRDMRGGQSPPEYFSSYNRATRLVTLSSALTVGQVVYFNYSWIGCLVRIPRTVSARISNHFAKNAAQRGWYLPIDLEAV